MEIVNALVIMGTWILNNFWIMLIPVMTLLIWKAFKNL